MEPEQIACLEKTAAFVEHSFAGMEPGHDFFHVERVVSNAKRILQDEHADEFIVLMTAYLHDMTDHKFFADDSQLSDFLHSLNLDEKTIALLLDTINSVSYSSYAKTNSIELQIVQDADRLDAIGAIGIARTFSYGAVKGNPFFDKDIPPVLNMTKEQYKKHRSTTINHFHEKLLKLKDLMHTKTAKNIAEQRHAFMVTFLEQWDKEITCS